MKNDSKNIEKTTQEILDLRKKIISKKTDNFFRAAEEIMANQPGELGFICRSMVTASMPHSKTTKLHFKRVSNNFTLSIVGNDEAGGVPYGIYPRLILSWLATEVVRTQSREVLLGYSLSAFMKKLGLGVTGGKWGTISRFKEQLRRLFSSHITLTYQDKEQGKWLSANLNIADKLELFWNPSKPDQLDIFNSKVTLSEIFFEEILKAPIPVDIRAINVLKDSGLALDIYFWLTYRLSYLKFPLDLTYETLQDQFGGYYENTAQGRYQFKKKFIIQLRKVMAIYQEAYIEIHEQGLLIYPSSSHINKISK